LEVSATTKFSEAVEVVLSQLTCRKLYTTLLLSYIDLIRNYYNMKMEDEAHSSQRIRDPVWALTYFPLMVNIQK
jgi:hypothetical protein